MEVAIHLAIPADAKNRRSVKLKWAGDQVAVRSDECNRAFGASAGKDRTMVLYQDRADHSKPIVDEVKRVAWAFASEHWPEPREMENLQVVPECAPWVFKFTVSGGTKTYFATYHAPDLPVRGAVVEVERM